MCKYQSKKKKKVSLTQNTCPWLCWVGGWLVWCSGPQRAQESQPQSHHSEKEIIGKQEMASTAQSITNPK